MLSDPQKRAAYDQYGHAGVDPNMAGAGQPGSGGFAEAFGDIFGEAGGDGPLKDSLKHDGIFERIGERNFVPTLGRAIECYLEVHPVEWRDGEDEK